MSGNNPKVRTLDEMFKIMRQSTDTQGISSNGKTSEELPAKNSDEQDNISTSTSSCSETCNNLHNSTYPDIAKSITMTMDDSVKQAILSSKWGDAHLFTFPSR